MDDELRNKISKGTARLPGFVLYDDSGYDRELARRSVGAGWSQLIDELFDFIDANDSKGWRVVQVKEKFGQLRVYSYGQQDADELWDFTNELKSRSATLCERCGALGEIRYGGWLTCLCKSCQADYDAGQRPWLEVDDVD